MKKLTMFCVLIMLLLIPSCVAIAEEFSGTVLTQPVELGNFTVYLPDGFQVDEDGNYVGMLGISVQATVKLSYNQTYEGTVYNTAADAEEMITDLISLDAEYLEAVAGLGGQHTVFSDLIYVGEIPALMTRFFFKIPNNEEMAIYACQFMVGHEVFTVETDAFGEGAEDAVSALYDAILATIVVPPFPG